MFKSRAFEKAALLAILSSAYVGGYWMAARHYAQAMNGAESRIRYLSSELDIEKWRRADDIRRRAIQIRAHQKQICLSKTHNQESCSSFDAPVGWPEWYHGPHLEPVAEE